MFPLFFAVNSFCKHSSFPHLSYPEKPQYQRNQDQKIKEHVIETLLFPDKVQDKDARNIGAYDVIEDHDNQHCLTSFTCSSARETPGGC